MSGPSPADVTPAAPRPTPRLVASDLDGTLLRSDGTVSPRSAAVLARLEADGVPVVFVTGRPLRWMAPVRDHVGGHGLAICSNGAVVVELGTDRVMLRRAIPSQTVIEVAADIRAALPSVWFGVEGTDGFAMEAGYPALQLIPAGTVQAPIADLALLDPVKLLARDDTADPDELLAVVAAVAGGRVVATRSDPSAMVEMSAVGVTKASTLALIADRFGVAAAEVVAFGDMPNDVAMLSWAGRSFAVAGAHPAAVAAATDRAAGNDDDGVAAALEAIFGF